MISRAEYFFRQLNVALTIALLLAVVVVIVTHEWSQIFGLHLAHVLVIPTQTDG